jgi:hypothetical protein
VADLRSALAELSPDVREAAFLAEDAFLARLHQSKDAWRRVFDLSQYGGIQLNTEKDNAWVRKRLSDPKEPIDHREMMLWVEMVSRHNCCFYFSLFGRYQLDVVRLVEDLRNEFADREGHSILLSQRTAVLRAIT